MIEIIYGVLLVLIIIYLLVNRDTGKTIMQWGENTKLADRVEKLEVETRYIADQPPRYYSVGSAFYDTDKWEEELHKNDVPINEVIKALVKHCGMEILKVPESTTSKPMEVKLVEQPKATGTVLSSDGTNATWVSPVQEKPKRKYTKRKTK